MLKKIGLWIFGGCLLLAAANVNEAAEPEMRLRLKDGSFGAGTIVGVEHDGQVGWSTSSFEQPFRFDVRSIRSLTRILDTPVVDGEEMANRSTSDKGAAGGAKPSQFIEMLGGSALVGQLTAMDEQWLTVDTPNLGTVRLAREQTVALTDAGYAGQVVYSGPLDDERWQKLSEEGDWEFEAGALVARRPGATIVGNVDLPPQSQINISLSWTGSPDFVLSLGTLANNRISKVEEVPSAARLEVWANQLALVREVDGGADIAMLAELNPVNPRIDLSLYLDQETGTIVACDAHGRPLETLKVAGTNPSVRPSVHLANSGPSLTVERFEVRQWDGVIATAAEVGGPGVLDSSGHRREGKIVGYESSSGELRIGSSDGQELRLPLSELRRGLIAQPVDTKSETQSDKDGSSEQDPPPVIQPPDFKNDGEETGDVNEEKRQPATDQETEAEGNTEDASSVSDLFGSAKVESAALDLAQTASEDPQMLEIVLLDRTRLKGHFLASPDAQTLRFDAKGVQQPLTISVATVRGLIGSSERYTAEVVEQPLGTLKSGEQQFYGYLESSNQGIGSEALVWHPQGSKNASPLSLSAVGSITYRKPLPRAVGGNAVDTAIEAPGAVVAPAVGMFLRRLGNNNGQAKADKAVDANVAPGADKRTQEAAPEAREILFRTGDAVDGVVEQIDESGLRFRSSQTDTQFVPHQLIQHVWLNKKRGAVETSPEKLKRLMTVPRSMKKDPPTHLLIAVNGDFLRGRLVELRGEKLVVEIRLEMIEMQTSQIAQIVWLHDRDWSERDAKEAAKEVEQTNQDKGNENGTENAQLSESQTADVVIDEGVKEVGGNEVEGETANLFFVHAIGRTERGLTFQPRQLVDGILSGHSDLLGQCAIAMEDVNQLLFGRDVTAQVRAYREDPWTLSLAQLPRVYMEDGGDPASGLAGGASPLVGQPATDFTLKTIAGESFRLSKNRDRVVVLDFWASWCGPCVQTMPLVEEAVAELGSDKIQLVAINIQETAARAQAAVDRLEMTSTVLLDSDGQTAAAYQANAIPQTVIIDRQGKVTHVFVGGGPKFVAQFKTALSSVVDSSIGAGFEAAGATPAE